MRGILLSVVRRRSLIMSIELIESGKVVSVRSVPPFDTGRVRIGLSYVPRYRWQPDADDEFMQSVLIGRGPRLGGIARVMSSLSQVIVWVVVFSLVLVLMSVGVSR